jgi:hypothetical protein
MGSLHRDANFPENSGVDLDSRLSLIWDTLYFLDSLTAAKVRKFAEITLRRTRRGPGGSTNS